MTSSERLPMEFIGPQPRANKVLPVKVVVAVDDRCATRLARVARGRMSLNTLRAASHRWFCDYLPVTTKNDVELFVDGQDYGSALHAALTTARSTVVMTGLHFMADFALIRGSHPTTLLDLIGDCFRRDVKVRLLVNQFIPEEAGIIRKPEWETLPESFETQARRSQPYQSAFRPPEEPLLIRSSFSPSEVVGIYLKADAWSPVSMTAWRKVFESGELYGYFLETKRLALEFQKLREAERNRLTSQILTATGAAKAALEARLADLSHSLALRTAIHRGDVFHSHHQKTVVIDDRVAFVGGVDLTDIDGDRWDTNAHADTNRTVDRTNRYWHDIHARIEGDAVRYVAANFEDRWHHDDTFEIEGPEGYDTRIVSVRSATGSSLARGPSRSEEPYNHHFPVTATARHSAVVQVVRMMPSGRFELGLQKPQWNRSGANFERSCKDSYLNGIRAARRYIYFENQWITDSEIWNALAEAARCNKQRNNRKFRIILVLPLKPLSAAGAPRGQAIWPADQAHSVVAESLDSETFGMYGLAQPGSEQEIYVHSKILMVDDCWILVGSANAGGTSMSGVVRGDQPDTELSLSILDAKVVRDFRHRLWGEHLRDGQDAKADADRGADAFRAAASQSSGRLRFHPDYQTAEQAADWMKVYSRQGLESSKRGFQRVLEDTSRAIEAARDTVRTVQRKVEELTR